MVPKIILDAALILVGYTSVVAQALLIRESVTVFSGNELSLGVCLAAWLFWVAVGSWGLGTFADRCKQKIKVFAITEMLLSLILPMQIGGMRAIRFMLGISPGQMIGLVPFFYATFILLAPLCVVVGFQFALGCKMYTEMAKDKPRAIGKVYIRDALGNMLGGFTFGYIFVNFFHPFQTAAGVAVLNLLLAMVLLVGSAKRITKLLIINFSLLLLSLGGLFSSALDDINRFAMALNWRGLDPIETASSKYGNFAVTNEGDLYSVYENGRLVFTNPDKIGAEEIIHFPMLEVPDPKRVLIIGDAISGGLQEVLKYPVEEIRYIELDPVFVTLAEKYITPLDRQALNDPRVKLEHIDGRLFVKRYRGEPFDAIILNVGDPTTIQLNRFYTLEFFRELSSIVKPEGVVFLSADSNENYLGTEMRSFNATVYRTLKEVFSDILLIPGDRLFLIASPSRRYLTYDTDLLIERLKRSGIETQFVNEYSLPYRFYPERIHYISRVLDEFKAYKLNFDFHPISYLYDIIVWSAHFKSHLPQIFRSMEKIRLRWVLVFMGGVMLCFYLFKKKLKKFFIPLAVMNTGFAGVSLELILLIGFQVLYGYLYHMVGTIVASFMLGLVIGAQWMNRHLSKIKNEVFVFSIWQLLLGGYLALIPVIFFSLSISSDRLFVLLSLHVLFPLLTVADGFLVGVIFPLANKLYLKYTEKVGGVAGMFYAVDLIGACIGSLAVTFLLIPVFGIPTSCILLATGSIASCVLLFSVRKLLPSP